MNRTPAISYCVRECTLGSLLVAATARGVCFVRFGGGELELEQRLKGAFPRWYAPVVVLARAPRIRPLDVRGSRFEERVWAALRQIPQGETRSYSEIARGLGNPRAARAVARACAENPAAVVIPCHRVIEAAGTLGGYGGGVSRKRALLEREGASFRD